MSERKERPILMSAPMVRAILDGRKTQTRRIVKIRGVKGEIYSAEHLSDVLGWQFMHERQANLINGHIIHCPYGVPGDRLWVRETWVPLLAVSPASDAPNEWGDRPFKRTEEPTFWTDDNGRTRWHYSGTDIVWRADGEVEFCDGDGFSEESHSANRDDLPRWRPSIHMPRWASRLTLEVTGVRVQRLNSISAEDATAEGVKPSDAVAVFRDGVRVPEMESTPIGAFACLWDSLNAKSAPWGSNPWVWVIEFRRIANA